MDETLFLQGVARKAARVSGRPDEGSGAISRIAAGDRRALEEIHARYSREIFRYLLTLTSDHPTAEEVLQDTLVAVWRGAKSFKGRSSVKTWLFGIARRQAHNALRKRKLPTATVELAGIVDAAEEPEDALLLNDLRENLAVRIRDLSPPHREVLALVFFHELSYTETARILDVPLGTVKSRLSNAKKALKLLLQDPEGTER